MLFLHASLVGGCFSSASEIFWHSINNPSSELSLDILVLLPPIPGWYKITPSVLWKGLLVLLLQPSYHCCLSISHEYSQHSRNTLMIYFFWGIPLLQMILLPGWVLSLQDIVANRSPWAFGAYIPHLTGSQVLCMLNTSSIIPLSMRFLSQSLLLIRQFLTDVKTVQGFFKINGRSYYL